MRLVPWRRRPELAPAAWVAGPFRRFRDQMDRLFDSFLGEGGEPAPTGATWMPEVDLLEGDEDFTLRAEVPGLDPKDIEVTVRDNILTLSGEKKEEKGEKKDNYYQAERRYGVFRRSIELPPGADPQKIAAEYDKGVLSITIAKEKGVFPRRISVKPSKKPESGSA